jgi:hypothetical protein
MPWVMDIAGTAANKTDPMMNSHAAASCRDWYRKHTLPITKAMAAPQSQTA